MVNILIIDDSNFVLEISKTIIEQQLKKVTVDTVKDPELAKNHLMKKKYNIVILDIVMPKVSGIELLGWIKKQETLKGIKVIMFSSVDDVMSLSEAFSLGAYDYIRKPLEKCEFLARLKHAISDYENDCVINKNMDDLASKNQELEKLNDQLRKAQGELIQSERLAGVGFLAAGIAHELNNPLSYIYGNLSFVSKSTKMILGAYNDVKQLVSDDDQNSVSIIEKKYSFDYISNELSSIYLDMNNGIDRMTKIVNALRNFSKVDSISDQEEINLSEVFNNIFILMPNIQKEGIEYKLNIDCEAIAYGDNGDVNLSLMHIITNSYEAIKRCHFDRSFFIKVNVEVENSHVIIVIEDNGIGMTHEVLEKSMDPFFTTKEAGDGVGLGLSLAYNSFVNRMNGSVNLYSKDGEGTTVIIKLPNAVVTQAFE